MAETKIKAAQFSGVVGNGVNGYVLQSSGDGDMEWVASITPPAITSLSYPGSATAADLAGGETITITGTGFVSGASVTVGGTAAPAVSFVSATTLTITTPAKAAGDYDVVVTNIDTGSATFINGISYNGIPAWSTAAGSLGTFASAENISTITLAATEPDGGTITFNITNGALPTGLSLTGANIDGTTSLETAETLYTFTVTATDNESQTTPRVFTITVQKQFIATENFTINTYTGNGSTQSIEGKIGTAASFNGSSSKVDLPSFGNTFENNFSYSLWFVLDSSPSGGISNLIATQGDYYNFSIIRDSDKKVETRFEYSGGGFDVLKSTSTFTDYGTWHHLTITKSSTNGAAIYIDGTLEASDATATSNLNATTSGNTLGVYGNGSLYWLDGKIDQVRIFNKALSSSEVTTLYGESNTSTTKSTTDIFDDSSGVALYEFEEGAKDTGGVNGKIGAGGIFNGSNSTIATPITTNYSNLSISCWVKFNALPTGNTDATLVSKGFYVSGSNTQYLHLRYEDYTDQFTFAIRQNSTYNQQATSGVTASVGVWYHVVGTLDSSGNAQIYVNGSAGTGITSAPTMTNSNNFEIGSFTSTTAILNGVIDQVRFFDKAVSSNEVTTLYGETAASATKSTTDIFNDSSGIALYELEGNANDSGRYGSGAIDDGQSAVFNGSSSVISIPSTNTTPIDFSTENWTISWRMYLNVLGQNKQIIGRWGASPGVVFLFRTLSSGGIDFYERDGTTSYLQSSAGGTVTAGQWYHMTYTRSGTEAKFYLDGSLNKTMTRTNAINQGGTEPINIGGNGSSGIDGKIDQVRFYSSALSASDVEALVSETNAPSANLSAHYKLDGDVTDETGNYNGTATSITYSDPAEHPVYNGTATNVTYGYDGTPTNVSFVGTSFQPDFVWIKRRSATENHAIFDSVRGVQKEINSNRTNAESTKTNAVSSFNSNGFTTGDNGATNASGQTYVAWNWKAGGTAVSNTDGTITSSVSANQDAGFSIVKYTGNSTAGATVGHGLSTAPQLIIIKNLNVVGGSSKNWTVYSETLGNTDYLYLNTSSQAQTYNFWNNTSPVSDKFTVSSDTNVNSSSGNYIAYCFHSVDGYQKIGSYTGTSGSVTVSDVGFQPRFVLIKGATAGASFGGSWLIVDSIRGDGGFNTAKFLEPHSSGAEFTNGVYGVTFTSNGFTIPSGSSVNLNTNNGTFIYLAIA